MRWHGPSQSPFRVRVSRLSGREEWGSLSGGRGGSGSGSIDSLLRLAVDRAIPWLKK